MFDISSLAQDGYSLLIINDFERVFDIPILADQKRKSPPRFSMRTCACILEPSQRWYWDARVIGILYALVAINCCFPAIHVRQNSFTDKTQVLYKASKQEKEEMDVLVYLPQFL